MAINIAVIGTGLVGKAFLSQLEPIAAKFGINVVLIARITGTVVSRDYSALPISIDNFSANAEQRWTTIQIAEFMAKSPLPAVLVDNTADPELAEAYGEFVSRNISIVTPNKKAFSSSLALWDQLFDPSNKALVYHESTVGAGLPIISSLNDLVITGDKVKTIQGVFSGTLSYIFNEFGSNDVKFSDVVTKAKALGYTEPDPRDDLNGLDVARKVTILSRLVGARVESPTSFPVQSLIPKPLESVQDISEFMDKLKDYDNVMDDLKQEAIKENKVLRFVGSVDLTGPKPEVNVSIEKFDQSHPFASLSGSDNMVAFVTERYPLPLVIRGAGAGDAVTAMGVLGDLIKIAQRLH